MLKSIITPALIVLLLTASFRISDTKEPESVGIKFFKGSFKEAKAKAKKENKLIFIDCYTTWCGPCKSMSKKTFVNKDVGEYYNKNFICLKMDMESGEGMSIAEEYSVQAYPTYLFLDYKGQLRHKDLGYLESGKFIEVGKTALSKK